jgi:carbon-monoxide dehydrogenase small subunit
VSDPRWIEADAEVTVDLTLNGKAAALEVGVRWTLADAIRAHGLTGTHLGCEHGVCGACTVLLEGEPVRACLVLALQAQGRRVETVEALGTPEAMHPVQEAFRQARALQCGFCTPGFVVLAAWLREREPDADPARVREVLSSNLCRCTGYGPIVEAVASAS